MPVGAIVAAAGLGTRLGLRHKALVPLRGRTVLSLALDLFLELDEVERVVVAAPEARLEAAAREVEALHAAKPIDVCAGGDSRQRSVRAALSCLDGCEYVLVHDAARPLATPELARRVLAAAYESGAAIPALAPRDAVKRVEGGRLLESMDRTRIVLAQTPQAFEFELLKRAHFEAADAGLQGDDDAQLVAAIGHAVAVVEGEPANIKLTTAKDMVLLEALLREREATEPVSLS